MFRISTRYAVRCLFRQRKRTFLSVLGVAIGCASSLVTISFVLGEGELFMRGVAETGTGHLRIAPANWNRLRENNLRIDDWQNELETVRAMEGVSVATPRARAYGLLGAGTRAVGVEVVGVDPDTEARSNRLVRGQAEGRYLETADAGSSSIAVVLGKAVADRLQVQLEDEVMLTVSDADGQMRQAMLRIVGLVSTGTDEIDATVCQIPLADMERITGLAGAGEIVMLLEDHRTLERSAHKVRAGLRGKNEVLRWDVVSPEMSDAVTIDESFTWLTVAIVVLLVFLGITSAQLTAVLERRREFAVLSALGMKADQLVRTMILEGLAVGVVGGGLGLALALPPVYLMAAYGVDMSVFWGTENVVVSEVLIDPILYGDMGLWLVPSAFGLSCLATLLGSIYPAWFAARTDPAVALRAV